MIKPEKLRDLRTASVLPLAKSERRASNDVRGSQRAPLPPLVNRTVRLSRTLDSLPVRAARRFMLRVVGNFAELVVYGGIAAAIGIASAWYMVDYGSNLNVERDGPWQRWTIAGAPGADPYTKAHFLRAGWLPLSTKAAHYYLATKDSSGEALYADCDYSVSGTAPPSRRWTLAAFDMTGLSIAPGGGRAVVSSSTALLGPEAALNIKVSSSTSPGNWLGLSGAARMQLLFTFYGRSERAVRANAGLGNGPTHVAMPIIVRTGCR
jgi:hypothetical protein